MSWPSVTKKPRSTRRLSHASASTPSGPSRSGCARFSQKYTQPDQFSAPGKGAASSTMTRKPLRARPIAADNPAAPAPTTITSYCEPLIGHPFLCTPSASGLVFYVCGCLHDTRGALMPARTLVVLLCCAPALRGADLATHSAEFKREV